jgi:hypothetical protein
MTITNLDDTDFNTLANICDTAATRFEEHAKAVTPGSLLLADQFTQQAAQAKQFASLFYRARSVTIVHDPE